MGSMGQRPASGDRAQLRRARIASPRAVPALLLIVIAALTLAGCGGSSKPKISLQPATITEANPATTAQPVAPTSSGKLTAIEYHKLKALTTGIHASRTSDFLTHDSHLANECHSVGSRTALLKAVNRNCTDMVMFLGSAVRVGLCFKGISSASTNTPSKLYGCERLAAPVQPESTKLASDMTTLNSIVRARGFSGKCYRFLAAPAALPGDLSTLASDTSALVSAAQQQNLAAALTGAQTWGRLLETISHKLAGGPKSIKVCMQHAGSQSQTPQAAA